MNPPVLRRAWSAPLLAILLASPGLPGPPGGSASAEPIRWSGPISTTVNGQDVAEFIRDFCSAQDISVSVSEGVSGTVNASFENRDPKEIFDSITKAYGLVPYYDGSILYVYAASEMKSSVISLESLETSEFRKLLAQLEILDENHTFRELADQGIVYVSGPPRYIELLVELGAKFDERSGRIVEQETFIASQMEVRVFKLRYASADDTTLDFQDNQVVVPGVATLLTHVLGQGGPTLVEGVGATRLDKPRTVEKLRGTGLIAGQEQFRDPPAGAPPAAPAAPETPEEKEEPMEAFIQADNRLNAVIVADKASRMPLYERLIRDLDQPAGVIEINAAIIEMNTNANLNWGVDYRSENRETLSRNDVGVPSATGTFRAGQNASEALADGAALVGGPGLATSASLVGTTWQILARIRALEEAGEAQVLSRPSVITIDNTEALLRDDSTLFVRVAGQEEVDLFPVSAGVLLRVSPSLIRAENEGERDMIRLQVKIEDGDFTNQNVDDIPIVRRSEITTQAVVAQSESLLIGGQYRHEQSNGEVGVPIAGRLPVVGNAFKNRRVVNSKRQRLFLISPNVINPEDYYRRADLISSQILSAPPVSAEDHAKAFAPAGAPGPEPRSLRGDYDPPLIRATPVEAGAEPRFGGGDGPRAGENLLNRFFTPPRR